MVHDKRYPGSIDLLLERLLLLLLPLLLYVPVTLYVLDKLHSVAAEAAAPAAAPAAARAADPWIHGSISFIMDHIFYYEMKNIIRGMSLCSLG